MIEQIDHVNIVVNDMAMMLAFYKNDLGLNCVKEVTISGTWVEQVVGLKGVKAEVVYLEFTAGPRIELIRYLSPPGMVLQGLSIANTFGIRHIAFRVRDIDDWVEKLKKKGIRFSGAVQQASKKQVRYTGGARKRLVYFYDPEGNILEFCEYVHA